MWEINNFVSDNHGEKSSVCLNPDKAIGLNSRNYPIIWIGLLNEVEIKILQKKVDASSFDSDFDFVVFPSDKEHLKDKVIEWIDNYYKQFD